MGGEERQWSLDEDGGRVRDTLECRVDARGLYVCASEYGLDAAAAGVTVRARRRRDSRSQMSADAASEGSAWQQGVWGTRKTACM